MKFGFSLSNNQGIEGVQTIVLLATQADALEHVTHIEDVIAGPGGVKCCAWIRGG
jgi:hypothetical protein